MPTCFIKDLKTGKVLKDQIENCAQAVFSNCDRFIYFVQKDKNFRPCRLMKHVLGDVYWEKTEEVYFAKDERVFLNVSLTKDMEWYIMSSVTKNGTSYKVSKRGKGSGMKWYKLFDEEDKITIFDHFSGQNKGFFFGANKEVFAMSYLNDTALTETINNVERLKTTKVVDNVTNVLIRDLTNPLK